MKLSPNLRALTARVACALLLVAGMASAGFGVIYASLEHDAYRAAAIQASGARRALARMGVFLSRELLIGDELLGSPASLLHDLHEAVSWYHIYYAGLIYGNESIRLRGLRDDSLFGSPGAIDAIQFTALYTARADAFELVDSGTWNDNDTYPLPAAIAELVNAPRQSLETLNEFFVEAVDHITARFEPWYASRPTNTTPFDRTIAGVVGTNWSALADDRQLRYLTRLQSDVLDTLLSKSGAAYMAVKNKEAEVVLNLEIASVIVQLSFILLLHSTCRSAEYAVISGVILHSLRARVCAHAWFATPTHSPFLCNAVLIFRRLFISLEGEARRTEDFISLLPPSVVDSSAQLRNIISG
ncbi:hypothetical protein EON66_06835 [archaeon]|nr:MAG: hypothetical protein EON66_06835 [archaeon]